MHTLRTQFLPALLALALTATVVAPVSEACAQDKLEEARRHFDRGTAFFRQARYDDALKELMAAYVLDPNPLLVYNIARVHEERGDLHNALKFFTNYLTISPHARNRRAVKKKVRALKRAIKHLPKQGFVSVKTDPPGAAVKVNGRFIGQTPVREARLSAGRYKLEVQRDRYQPYRADVVIQPGNNTRLDLRLVDVPSSVLITTSPPGGMASLLSPKRQPLGQCPCVVNLSSGRYTVRVEMNGHRPREFEFVKKPHEQLKVPVTLVPIQQTGQLLVQSNVPGAQIVVNGQAIGITPLAQPLRVPAGQIMLDVTARGHAPWRQAILVGPNGITNIQAMLQPIGAARSRVGTGTGAGPNGSQVVYRAQDTSSAQSGWGWALTGIGITAAVGGLTTQLLALGKQKTYRDGTYFRVNGTNGESSLIRQDMTQIDALALEKDATLMQNIAIGLYSGGGALVLTGIILLATDNGPEMESLAITPSFSPLPGGGFVQVNIPFQ